MSVAIITVILLVLSGIFFFIKACIEAGPKEVEDCRRGEYLKCYDHYVHTSYSNGQRELLKANYYWATGKTSTNSRRKNSYV